MEVKLLAVEALESGLSPQEVGELVGVGAGTIYAWRKDYAEGGVAALCRRASSIAVRKKCSALEEKIVTRRQEHPDHGVRRIQRKRGQATFLRQFSTHTIPTNAAEK